MFVAVDERMSAYRLMCVFRRFEELVGDAVASGEIHGEMHLGIGQEAIAAALSSVLRSSDAVVSTHRAHLHALALGVDPIALLAEVLERDGLSHGKGGHMHLFSSKPQFMCTGIVAAGAPIATGYALTQQRRGSGDVTVAVTGDGAMNQGAVFESMNLAALWHLPMVFLCEDNQYGISVHRDTATAGRFSDRGSAFGIPGADCDGTDVEDVHPALRVAVERARRGEGPSVVVATCYRFRGHYEGDADIYRPKSEKDAAMSPERDPLARLRRRLTQGGSSEDEIQAVEQEAASVVTAWAEQARNAPKPDPRRVREDVFA
jgi:acetoin:2,6-dichlorophenolindophenol oxidoreductase subunit alpha